MNCNSLISRETGGLTWSCESKQEEPEPFYAHRAAGELHGGGWQQEENQNKLKKHAQTESRRQKQSPCLGEGRKSVGESSPAPSLSLRRVPTRRGSPSPAPPSHHQPGRSKTLPTSPDLELTDSCRSSDLFCCSEAGKAAAHI